MAAITGCSRVAGPASTDTSSDSLPSLEERVEFLQKYVTFRRGYDDLGFHITYSGGGLVPGPSEWDIRLVAVVPSSEISEWVPAGEAAMPTADKKWLINVPGAERTAGIEEWYTKPGKVIGIDRKHSVVAYRSWAH